MYIVCIGKDLYFSTLFLLSLITPIIFDNYTDFIRILSWLCMRGSLNIRPTKDRKRINNAPHICIRKLFEVVLHI